MEPILPQRRATHPLHRVTDTRPKHDDAAQASTPKSPKSTSNVQGDNFPTPSHSSHTRIEPLLDSMKSSDRPTKSSALRNTLVGWWMEVAWLLTSIASLIALVVLLHVYDDEPLPQWPSSITLNTVIALLSTVCRSAFIAPVMEAVAQAKWLWFKKRRRPLHDFAVFENASRGAAGSLQLLRTTRARIIGLLPAVILVSALGTATVTQLAVAYPQRRIEAQGTGGATMMRSSEYFWQMTVGRAKDGLVAPIHMAVTRALYSSSLEQPLFSQPDCRTSNCTWDHFSTLGVCTELKNITDDLSVTDDDLSLPNNITFQRDSGTTAVTYLRSGESIAFDDDEAQRRASLLSLFVVREYDVFQATEVLFHRCVNTFAVDVTNNLPKVVLVHSSADTHFGEALLEKYNETANVTYLTTPHDKGQKYIFGGGGILEIQNAIKGSLEGSVTDFGRPKYTNGTEAFAAAMHETRLAELGIDGQNETQVITGEWEAMHNVSQNIAIGLSSLLADQEVSGTAWAMETFVQVRWKWLTLLIAQVCLSAAMLVYMIVASARSGVEIIKTSPLPALFAIPADEKLALEHDTETMRLLEKEGASRLTTAAQSVDGTSGLRRRGQLWEIQ